ELDDRGNAAEVFGEPDALRRAAYGVVVEAALGVEVLSRGNLAHQMGVDESGDISDEAELRSDLLVVSDDDGSFGESKHRKGEQIGLGSLVDNDNVERGTAGELFDGPV